MPYYVDIPQRSNIDPLNEGEFLNVGTFKTREEAIAFAREWFGADEQGMVCLVTGGDDPATEEVAP